MPPAAPIKIAALQMCSTPQLSANLDEAERLLRQAAQAGARLAVLPENFSFMGGSEIERLAVAEPDGDGPVQRFLAGAARELGLYIIGGTTPLRLSAPGAGAAAAAGAGRAAGGGERAAHPEPEAQPETAERVAAACLVYAPDGRRIARYDKIHLFDVDLPRHAQSYRESAHIAPGSRAVLAPTPAGLIGLSVCYDLRFPELYRRLAAAGARCLTVPAAFTVPTGSAHWEVLLRARAIENLCYVVAAAQSGRHANGRETFGDSLIVDYWGRVLSRLTSGPGVVIAELDPEAQAQARRDFPALTHRVL